MGATTVLVGATSLGRVPLEANDCITITKTPVIDTYVVAVCAFWHLYVLLISLRVCARAPPGAFGLHLASLLGCYSRGFTPRPRFMAVLMGSEFHAAQDTHRRDSWSTFESQHRGKPVNRGAGISEGAQALSR